MRFVTGTDEHGEKIAAAAAANGMSPQQHCDRIVQEYEALWKLVRGGGCCLVWLLSDTPGSQLCVALLQPGATHSKV